MSYISQEVEAYVDTLKQIESMVNGPANLDAAFDSVVIQTIDGTKVHMNTTEVWNSQSDFIGRKGDIYVYTDHDTFVDESGQTKLVPGIKISDGLAYLIDQPFTDSAIRYQLDFLLNSLRDHAMNLDIHVTEEEKLFWNNKVTCFANGDEVIFTKGKEIENG